MTPVHAYVAIKRDRWVNNNLSQRVTCECTKPFTLSQSTANTHRKDGTCLTCIDRGSLRARLNHHLNEIQSFLEINHFCRPLNQYGPNSLN